MDRVGCCDNNYGVLVVNMGDLCQILAVMGSVGSGGGSGSVWLL